VRRDAAGPDGLLVVDKPAGWTSHDVVGRVRRLAGTRKVGHAGTLDPMATGVLLCGIGRATRLLGHLALHDKTYRATIRLGETTTTDDAEGETLQQAPVTAESAEIAAAMAALTGDIAQVPSTVSAIKVDGRRAYARARAGEEVSLPARQVQVSRFDLLDRSGPDLDVAVTCSSGTYVRALARDLGAALGCGGHLTALRRTRVGAFDVERAHTMDELAKPGAVLGHLLSLDEAVAGTFPRRDLTAEETRELGYGRRIAPSGRDEPVGAFAPDGTVVALLQDRDGVARPMLVFAPAPAPAPAPTPTPTPTERGAAG
jgi:tRNA pseudouridine55 synthase